MEGLGMVSFLWQNDTRILLIGLVAIMHIWSYDGIPRNHIISINKEII